MFRENTEGVYVGVGGRFKAGTPDEVAIQEDINTRKGVERIIRHAFEFAARARADAGLHGRQVQRDARTATSSGSACSRRSRRSIPEIEATHLYIDALAMLMVKDPGQFEVIVTNNLFGDIVTDLGAALQGGLGMAASGNIHPGPDVAVRARARLGAAARGQERRQPDGRDPVRGADARDLGWTAEARRIEEAVEAAVHAGRDDQRHRRRAGHARGRRRDRCGRRRGTLNRGVT